MKLLDLVKKKLEGDTEDVPVTIAFIGDSVTHGCFELYRKQGDRVKTEYRSYNGYPYKLKRIMETVFPAAAISIINSGISGTCAPHGEKRLERDVISHNPQLAVVCYGLNDSSLGMEKISEYTDALRGIFKKLKNAGIDTIFMTPNMIAPDTTDEIFDEKVKGVIDSIVIRNAEGNLLGEYIKQARLVCREMGVKVCDCYEKWEKLQKNGADITRLLANRVNHPTEEMHWLFAWSLFDTILNFDE